MRPILFVLPIPFTDLEIPFFAYEVLYIIGIMAGTLVGLIEVRKRNLNPSNYLDATIIAVISGFIGARFFYIFQHFGFFSKNPVQVIRLWEGGYVFYGAFIGGFAGLIIYLWFKKLPLLKYLDVVPVPLGVGIFFGRIGCFQLYEASEGLLLAIAFYFLPSFKKDGLRFLYFVMSYAILRFINEFFRGDVHRGFVYENLSVSQGVSIVIVLLCIFILIYFLRWN